MPLPPLPKGAVFSESGLPPLPEGAEFVSSDRSIPTIKNLENAPTPIKEVRSIPSKLLDKITEAMTLGGQNRWESDLETLGGQKPETATDYASALANKIVENSDALMGIPVLGEVSPAVKYLSASTNIPSVMKMPEMAKPVVTKAKEIIEPVAEKASEIGKKIAESPSKFLGWTSKTDPESIKLAYRIGKEGSPELKEAFKAGKALEMDDYSQMIYNYARKLGLPHEEAMKATHYRQDLETGAWNLWNKFKKQNPLGLPGWEKASDAQKLKMAEQAGFDLGSIIPTKKNAKAMLGLEGGLGYLAHMTPYLKHLVSAKLLPALGLQSPRMVGELAYRTGQARKVIPPILRGVQNLSGSQIVGGLGQAVKEEQD